MQRFGAGAFGFTGKIGASEREHVEARIERGNEAAFGFAFAWAALDPEHAGGAITGGGPDLVGEPAAHVHGQLAELKPLAGDGVAGLRARRCMYLNTGAPPVAMFGKWVVMIVLLVGCVR